MTGIDYSWGGCTGRKFFTDRRILVAWKGKTLLDNETVSHLEFFFLMNSINCLKFSVLNFDFEKEGSLLFL